MAATRIITNAWKVRTLPDIFYEEKEREEDSMQQDLPIRRIAQNAGQDGSVIAQEVRRLAKSRRNKNVGFNVLSAEYVDMIESGIIDPLKVTRSAVENAASVAAMVLTTDALVVDIPEPPAPAPAEGEGMPY